MQWAIVRMSATSDVATFSPFHLYQKYKDSFSLNKHTKINSKSKGKLVQHVVQPLLKTHWLEVLDDSKGIAMSKVKHFGLQW